MAKISKFGRYELCESKALDYHSHMKGRESEIDPTIYKVTGGGGYFVDSCES